MKDEPICTLCMETYDPRDNYHCEANQIWDETVHGYPHVPMPAPTTLADVTALVERVRANVGRGTHMGSPEAHAAEDSIAWAVLRAIANGTADAPLAMAAKALELRDLDYARWFA